MSRIPNSRDARFRRAQVAQQAADAALVERVSTLEVSGVGGGSSTLAGLSDVSVSGVAVGQVLQWDGSAWVGATVSGGGGGTSDYGSVADAVSETDDYGSVADPVTP